MRSWLLAVGRWLLAKAAGANSQQPNCHITQVMSRITTMRPCGYAAPGVSVKIRVRIFFRDLGLDSIICQTASRPGNAGASPP